MYRQLTIAIACFASLLAEATPLEELDTKGFTVVSNLFSPSQLEELLQDYTRMKEKGFTLMGHTPARPRYFQENNTATESRFWKTDQELILQAGPGRYDFYQGFVEGSLSSPEIAEHPALLALMQEILRNHFTYEVGLLCSEPGSSDQYWHRDVDTMSNTCSDGAQMVLLDDFYFTILIPLRVPFTYENGATEFLVGSHRLSSCDFSLCPAMQQEVPLGSALVFNGKINHRGRANQSSQERSTLYITYHKKWYNESFRNGVN